jgi:4-hydroxythreonine-4-phosphate dehydrogenase
MPSSKCGEDLMTAEAASRPEAASPDRAWIAVSMGDPAGIGLDIVLAAWHSRALSPLPRMIVYGDPDALADRARRLGIDADFEVVETPRTDRAGPAQALEVVPVRLAVPAVPGRPDSANGPAIVAAIEQATAAVACGAAAAIVTNPIAKSVLYAAGFAHPGHTEFLGELARRHYPHLPADPVMLLASDDLRVVPLTVHIPLADVPRAVTRRRILDVCRITAFDLRRRFAIPEPRLAIAGLNPHAGEQGTIGREEIDVIGPAIAELRAEGITVTGPHSADTLFHAAARRRYDVAICMFHDQALIPIKTLAFDSGVNVTLGLPFVRTSPDHGTAFDIAGSGRANPESFIAALHLAARLSAPHRAARS